MSEAASPDALRFAADGLIPIIVQDRRSGQVRMMAYGDAPAIHATLDTGWAHFFSRSRQRSWMKGETSGNRIRVFEVWTDCDRDCVLYLGEASGPSCHTGRESCFFRPVMRQVSATQDTAPTTTSNADTSAAELPIAAPLMATLWRRLSQRAQAASGARSYTKALLDAGQARIAAKIREEGQELAEAVQHESADRVIAESADVIYHTLAALLARDVTWQTVVSELGRRFAQSGHAEKASRPGAAAWQDPVPQDTAPQDTKQAKQ
ncbi:MAG: bifunctional phosphoribosyl-AMP cyclohydrolase/phosphoribosyl-ATP diphosphatase HisIE [Polyangiales bacterium]